MALLDTFIKILKKGEKEQAIITKDRLPSDEITIGKSAITFKSIDDKNIEAFNTALKQEGYKGPGINLNKIGKILSEKLDGQMRTLNMNELILAITKDNEQFFKFLKRDPQSLEDVVATAKGFGLDRIAENLLTRKPGEVLPVEHLVGGLLLISSLGRNLDEMATQIKTMPKNQERKDLYQKFYINVQIMKNLIGQVSAVGSEAGRTLGIISQMKRLQSVDLDQFYDQANKILPTTDDNYIDAHIEMYASLPKVGRLEFQKQGMFARGYDVLMEIYINSLLASPVTHVVNIAGNALYNIQRTVETGLAGLVGEVRTNVLGMGKKTDRVFLGEANAEAYGMKMALRDALKSSALTLSIEGAENVGSKIDLKNMVSIGNTDNVRVVLEQIQNIKTGGPVEFGKTALMPALNIIGIMTRMPGRFLASEDAFFKVITERKVLYREAYKASQIKYETLIKGGVNKDTAKKEAEFVYKDILLNVDKYDDIKKLMTQEAKESTFQEDPQGAFSALVRASNLPGGKVIVPFSKTPTNIVKAVFDRTLNWSTVYKAVKQGEGAEFDKAFSKLVLGNSIFASFVYLAMGEYGDNIIINGSGPSDPKARKFVEQPPYSVGFKQEDGSYKYITFSRFDPLSGVLAMASDYAYYAQNSGDADMISLENLFTSGVLAVAEYAMNMPFLQGVSELHNASFNPQGTSEKFFERMQQYFGQKIGGVITSGNDFINQFVPGQPFVGANSFTATVERVGNPDASNVMLNEEQLIKVEASGFPNVMRGFYTALNRAKSRNPVFSPDLPPALNFWGEVRQQTSGKITDYFSPVKIQDVSYDAVNTELVRLAESGAGTFRGHPKRYKGSYLTAEEYNEYIYNFNNLNVIDANKGLFLLPSDPGWKAEETIKEKLRIKITDTGSGYNVLTDDEKFAELNTIKSKYSKGAIAKLFEMNPSTYMRVEDPEKLSMGGS